MLRLALGATATVAVLGGAVSAASATNSRSVTLAATSPSIALGGSVTLLGSVDAGNPFTCPPGAFCPAPPAPSVTILARHDRSHPFRRIAVVHSEAAGGDGSQYAWQLQVSPRRGTMYLAVSGGARSRPLRVRVFR
jgi:hypothetical protein